METLKVLSELPGAPGREERVREFIQGQVSEYVDQMTIDAMGNLICVKRASAENIWRRGEGASGRGEAAPQRLMVACHMDEIAFIVRHIDDKGFLRLQHLGGFDARNLFARRVRVQTRDGQEIVGNLNFTGKPVHTSTPEERSKVPQMGELFVDVGLEPEEIRRRVRVGDPVTMIQTFVELGDRFSGKSLDNRIACWLGVRLLQRIERPAYDLYVVFTVQEEIGVRGAITSSYQVEPDVGIALDVTLAVDLPGISEPDQITTLGGGAAIKVMDSLSVSDKGLVDTFIALAEEQEIPYQLEVLPFGGTDAGALQRTRAGCRVITLSVPTRYVHTVTETAHKKDLQAALDLLVAFASRGPDAGGGAATKKKSKGK